MYEINIWAVLVSTLAVMVIGWFWYSQAGFGKTWMQLIGKTPEQISGEAKGNIGPAMAGALVVAFIESYVFAKLLVYAGVSTTGELVTMILLVWLGIIMAITYNDVLFNGRPRKLWLLQGFCQLANLVAIGLIVYYW